MGLDQYHVPARVPHTARLSWRSEAGYDSNRTLNALSRPMRHVASPTEGAQPRQYRGSNGFVTTPLGHCAQAVRWIRSAAISFRKALTVRAKRAPGHPGAIVSNQRLVTFWQFRKVQ